MIDAIFGAYFQIVPFQFFVITCSVTLLIQFFYEFVGRWDMV